jgi:hypothetical protein
VWQFNIFQDKLPYTDQGFPLVYLQVNDSTNQELQPQKMGVTYVFNYTLALYNEYTNYGSNFSRYSQYLEQLNSPLILNILCI